MRVPGGDVIFVPDGGGGAGGCIFGFFFLLLFIGTCIMSVGHVIDPEADPGDAQQAKEFLVVLILLVVTLLIIALAIWATIKVTSYSEEGGCWFAFFIILPIACALIIGITRVVLYVFGAPGMG